MLKQILYARGQIPCLFDQAKKIFSSNPKCVPRTFLQRKEKIIHSALCSFELLFRNLKTSISQLQVSEVIFSLGPTLISPKEVYVVQLPPSLTCKECELKSLNQLDCTRYFFRNVISSGILNLPDCPLLTKMTVMIKISRNNNLQDFMRLRYYKIPKRGKKLTICIHHKNCDHQPFIPFSDENSNDSDTLIQEIENLNINENSDGDLDQFCWIQLLPTVKGFKDLMAVHNHQENWM